MNDNKMYQITKEVEKRIVEQGLPKTMVNTVIFLNEMGYLHCGMDELFAYIEVLEKEIKNQTYLLERYISHKNWIRAGRQQEYLNGLSQALFLAQAKIVVKNYVSPIERVKNE